ncbi:MAG: hypothetical protein WCO90_05740 [Planctomycetota bacterium]
MWLTALAFVFPLIWHDEPPRAQGAPNRVPGVNIGAAALTTATLLTGGIIAAAIECAVVFQLTREVHEGIPNGPTQARLRLLVVILTPLAFLTLFRVTQVITHLLIIEERHRGDPVMAMEGLGWLFGFCITVAAGLLTAGMLGADKESEPEEKKEKDRHNP